MRVGAPDGDVVDLLLVEHGQGVRLLGGLVGAVSDEEGTVLHPRQITGKAEKSYYINFYKIVS